HEPLNIWSSVGRGLVAAVIGGVVAYLVAVYLPGSAILTALLGMIIGGLICIPIIWNELKLLLRL
ncbi:MAG TPA: hypothetical protein VFQ23_02570, partial [Anaerolineales bacterium]|nr:hypothetical protein [Anaerolineales bacterium]